MSAAATIAVSSDELDRASLAPILRHVRGGGLIAYPTETVYGFGGLARPDALARLERLKPRPGRAGFLVLVSRRSALPGLVWSPSARVLADAFWPGPLTLVLSDPNRTLPSGVRSDRDTVAVRISPHPVVAALTAALDAPLTSTSANEPGSPPALDAEAATRAATAAGMADELLVVDGGPRPAGPPSTIVDVSGPEPRILRVGAVSVDRLRAIVPEIHER